MSSTAFGNLPVSLDRDPLGISTSHGLLRSIQPLEKTTIKQSRTNILLPTAAPLKSLQNSSPLLEVLRLGKSDGRQPVCRKAKIKREGSAYPSSERRVRLNTNESGGISSKARMVYKMKVHGWLVVGVAGMENRAHLSRVLPPSSKQNWIRPWQPPTRRPMIG